MSYIVTIINELDDLFVRVRPFDEENSLSEIQLEVGGYVETCNWFAPRLAKKDIDVFVCEDKTGKPLTVQVRRGSSMYSVHGNICFAKHDGEGNTLGMSCEECLMVIADIVRDMEDYPVVKLSLKNNDQYQEWMMCLEDNELLGGENIAQA